MLVQSTRLPVRSGHFGPRSTEQAPEPSWRYYISSEVLDAQAFSATIRAHWAIEIDASKGSQKTKRKRWSDDYLQELFGLTPCSVSHAQISSDG